MGDLGNLGLSSSVVIVVELDLELGELGLNVEVLCCPKATRKSVPSKFRRANNRQECRTSDVLLWNDATASPFFSIHLSVASAARWMTGLELAKSSPAGRISSYSWRQRDPIRGTLRTTWCRVVREGWGGG